MNFVNEWEICFKNRQRENIKVKQEQFTFEDGMIEISVEGKPVAYIPFCNIHKICRVTGDGKLWF